MKLHITNIKYEGIPEDEDYPPIEAFISVDQDAEDIDLAIVEAITEETGCVPDDYEVSKPNQAYISPHLLRQRERRRQIAVRRQAEQMKNTILANLPPGSLLNCDRKHGKDTICVDLGCWLEDDNPFVKKTKEIKSKEEGGS